MNLQFLGFTSRIKTLWHNIWEESESHSGLVCDSAGDNYSTSSITQNPRFQSKQDSHKISLGK